MTDESTTVTTTDAGATIEKLVLVVEDDTDLRQTIQFLLEDEGLQVETAQDGREGLERAKQHKPALVVLDMNLPLVDGFGVANGLRSLYGDSVSIMTMTADGRAEEKAKRAGAVRYLSKPFELDALIETVWAILGQS